jgi:hypothetical protein
MVALALPLKAAVVMPKAAEVAAAGIVTDAGTVRAELLLARLIKAPPLGAAVVKVTVQVEEAFGPTMEGLQRSSGFARPTTTAARLTLVFTEKLL